MSARALNRARIVESSAFIAAPLCGLLLSQFGADVIRIDNIGGGIDYNRMPRLNAGRSLYWTSLNKNKRSVAVNLRKPEGRDLVKRLVAAPAEDGGILLTNVAAAWMTHQQLKELRADLISCTIEGNFDGTTAVDYTVHSATGYPFLTGDGGSEPINNPFPAWDVICAHQASAALTASILRRRQVRDGAEIRVALSDVAFSTLSHLGLISEAQLSGERRPATGNYIYGAFGRDFASADGRRVMVAAISARQWSSLVEACRLAEPLAVLQVKLAADFDREEDRFEHREAIAGLIELWCEQKTYAEIATSFDTLGVCWGPYQTVDELVLHDRRVSLENPVFATVTTPGIGHHLAAGAAFRVSAETRPQMEPAPFLGTHTEAVLGEVLGVGRRDFLDLAAREIVAGPEKDPYYER